MGGVIVAGLSLDWLADYIAQKGTPRGAALAIMDRNGTYLARYPANGRFVGTKMPGDKYLNHGRPGCGRYPRRRWHGADRGYSALQADSGALVVSFGLNKAQAFTEIQDRTLRDILLIALSTSLVLVLTTLGRPPVHPSSAWRIGLCRKPMAARRIFAGAWTSGTNPKSPGSPTRSTPWPTHWSTASTNCLRRRKRRRIPRPGSR